MKYNINFQNWARVATSKVIAHFAALNNEYFQAKYGCYTPYKTY